MKRYIIRVIIGALPVLWIMNGCSFLDPKLSGTYNDENYTDYPQMVRGLVEHAYNMRPRTYESLRYAALDAFTDNAVYRDETSENRLYSIGSGNMNNTFVGIWTND